MKAFRFIILAVSASCLLTSCTKQYVCTCTTINPATGAQSIEKGNIESGAETFWWAKHNAKRLCERDYPTFYSGNTTCTLD